MCGCNACNKSPDPLRSSANLPRFSVSLHSVMSNVERKVAWCWTEDVLLATKSDTQKKAEQNLEKHVLYVCCTSAGIASIEVF